MSKYIVGPVGFIFDNKIIHPFSEIVDMTIHSGNDFIRISEDTINDLLKDGYIYSDHDKTKKPEAKFKLGQFVRIEQISGLNGEILYSKESLKKQFEENYLYLTNGMIGDAKFLDECNEWSYLIVGPSHLELKSEAIKASALSPISGEYRILERDLVMVDRLVLLINPEHYRDEQNKAIEITIGA